MASGTDNYCNNKSHYCPSHTDAQTHHRVFVHLCDLGNSAIYYCNNYQCHWPLLCQEQPLGGCTKAIFVFIISQESQLQAISLHQF